MDQPEAPGRETTAVPNKPETLEQCHAVIDQMGQELAQLREQVSALLDKKLNSRNSSKPPSSDGPGSGGKRAQRRASGRARGAQPGHKGTYRTLLAESEVDVIHDCRPPQVCECGGPVVAGRPMRHQVFDVPAQVEAEVQEYRLYHGVCGHCRKTHKSVLPAGVPRGQIGPRALALVGLLGTAYHLTQPKIRDLLAQVLGVRFSVGAISQAHGLVAQALKEPVQAAVKTLAVAPVVHVDETSYAREGAGRHWVWTVTQPKLVVYQLWSSRARYVAKEMLGEHPKARLITDRYAVYDWVDPAQRQVCWAHLLRDFTRISQRAGQAGRIGRRLLGLGYVLFRRWHRRDQQVVAQMEPVQRHLQRALERGASGTCQRTALTCANVLKLWPALWTFLSDPAVPPTNNAAEQALRTIVLKRKISGLTRSRRGEEFIARGYTVVESCKRQGRDALAYLRQAMQAHFAGSAAPSLVPSG
jgi:transposase